jgi:hypothetical protein
MRKLIYSVAAAASLASLVGVTQASAAQIGVPSLHGAKDGVQLARYDDDDYGYRRHWWWRHNHRHHGDGWWWWKRSHNRWGYHHNRWSDRDGDRDYGRHHGRR